ncbi:PRP38-domain-containing protein [Pleomassaria siparia CBS 279.74]|uniref:Pre-mRNA-splicing factor 38 n=1 Tax=Pleomassaria siparia CBS 279.74 TaxID=1314801 RepID=A0A6G1KQL4_9PLEO|nr:PRP38-domain-containing protein [Pleomassaria siparia CBS 279.74]
MGKDEYHKADAKALLDDRGYSGALIRGQNPALLFEKGVRDRITESYYWKEQCFGLNAATLCDRAAELKFIGGTTGIMGKPTPFLCLAFKLLQLVPEKQIILEYLNFSDDHDEEEEEVAKSNADDAQEGGSGEDRNGVGNRDGNGTTSGIQDPNALGKLGEFKYLRCLAAFYIRLAWQPVEIFTTLEPLLSDSRKIRRRTKEGFVLTYMDQFVDDLLTKDRMCATSLWKLPSRANLEDLEMLEPRESALGDEVDLLDAEDEASDGDVQIVDSDGERSRRRYDSDDSRSGRGCRRRYDSDDSRSGRGSRRSYYSDDDRSDRGSRRTQSSEDDRSRRRSGSRGDMSGRRQRRRSESGERSEGEVGSRSVVVLD